MKNMLTDLISFCFKCKAQKYVCVISLTIIILGMPRILNHKNSTMQATLTRTKPKNDALIHQTP